MLDRYKNIAKQHRKKIPLYQRWKLVAILAAKKPIAIAINNQEKTHPVITAIYPLRHSHAEVTCLRKAPKEKIKNSTMYVFRFGFNGFRLAKPCKLCMDFLSINGVKKVIYSTNNGWEEIRL